MKLVCKISVLALLIALGHPVGARAGYGLVDATAVSTLNAHVDLGGGVNPLTTTTIYSNTTNFSGYEYAAGGTGQTGLGNTTTMVADDINPTAGTAGTQVTSISFSVANLNTTAVTANLLFYIYNSAGSGGGPGSLLAALEFNPISFGSGVTVFTYTSASTIFTTPSGTFWAGESFTDAGTGSATTAQLNGLGVGLFNPPTIGTSQDVFFQANSSSSTDTNNPAGGFFYFGGNPVANFGFSFSGTVPSVVPEPSSLILTGFGGVILALAGARKVGTARRPS